MDSSAWYWILGIVIVVAAALASWRVVTKGKINNVKANQNSIAAGRDINVNSRNKEKP